MVVLEEINLFYQNVVNLLLDDHETASAFVKMIAASMMYGKEQNVEEICSSKFYEAIFKKHLTDYEDESLKEDLEFAKNLILTLQSGEHEENQSVSTIKEAYDYFSKMCNVKRAGWIARNVPDTHGENDAVHIMQMFAIAYIYFKLDKNLNLDKKKVYEMIIIHEIAESLVGDIREGTKEHDKKAIKEKDAVEEIFSSLNSGQYFISLWQEFEQKQTEEAEFVYQLDKLDPILKAKILDSKLNRNDLYDDFYGYEERRKTYQKGKIKELFDYSKKMEVRNI